MLDPNPNEGAAARGDYANISEVDDVTAKVTSGDQPASDTPTVAEFMSAAVPWPVDDELGYVNLQYSMVNRKNPSGKLIVGAGKPFREVDKLVSYAAWINTTTQFKDVWYCLSLQSQVKPHPKHPGKFKAVRAAANALAVKAIWIDMDVGDGPHKYPTISDALTAAIKFREDLKLPPYSAIVGSGSGIHLYWISDVPLSPAQWKQYAEGLKALLLRHNVKCDAGLTTDIARILRVPGTFNRKTNPAKPVQLFDVPLKLYNFATDLALLPTVAPARTTASAAAFSPFVNPTMDFAKFGRPIFQINEPGLEAGIDKFSNAPLDPKPIFIQCGFLREALLTGGRDYDEPLWNQSVLCTTFMKNGNDIAHRISKGHPSYSEAETQSKFDLKMAARHSGGIGYPSCATIAGFGCEACKTCPLFAKGKSPLNIRPVVTATVKSTSSPSGSSGQASWTGQSGISFANIPHRKWLYGFDLVRGELTVIGSPGGAGKSSLAIGMAICAATGRELLGEKIRGGSNLKALIINAEDSTVELRRRTHAFCLAHNVAARDLNGLTVVGADDLWVQQISFLRTNEKGMSALNQDSFDALQLALDALHPDVIVLDPLVSFCAGGNMNDNAVMSSVMRKLKEIAARHECAVLIVHHTRKGGDAGNVETISGAAAITNLARRTIMPAPLTDDDVKRLAILPSERFQYFKLVDAKSNLAPRATDSPLYRLQSVELPNPEPPLYPHGDNVQAITRVTLPIQSSGVVNGDNMKIELAIQEVVYRGKEIDGHAYPYSPSLAGASNQRALMPDALAAVANATAPRHWAPGDLEATIKTAINKMQADGRLVVEDMEDLMPKPGRFRRGRGLKAVPI